MSTNLTIPPLPEPLAIRHDGGLSERSLFERYDSDRLLLSSANRGWSGMSAELWNHPKAVIPWKGSQSGVAMCVDLRGNESLVTRRNATVEDRRISSRDTIWLTPPDLQEGVIDIDADMAGVLHIHLPLSQFSQRNLGINIDKSAIGALRYEAAFDDRLLAEIAHAVTSELQAKTSAGGLLIQSLATSMTARLIQKHTRGSPLILLRRLQEKAWTDAGYFGCSITSKRTWRASLPSIPWPRSPA